MFLRIKENLFNKALQYSMAKENIYILPTKLGFIYTGILFTVFLIGLTYTNNLTLICAFLMLTYFLIQMLKTHKTIKSINFKYLETTDSFADTPLNISAKIKNNPDFKLINCSLYRDKKEYQVHIKKSTQTLIQTSINLPRGKYNFNRIKFYSTGESKLFYCWKYRKVNQILYVYPSRIDTENSLLKSYSLSHLSVNEEEFSHHIPYVQELSAKRIDWNVFAKNEQLYWKKHIGSNSSNILIDLNKLEADFESRLSHAAYLIEYLYRNSIKWAFKHKGMKTKTDYNLTHFRHCLEILSEARDD